MDLFHDFCVKHELKYSLAYGTLLGAVRHKGFIPWDDDIDVMMPRGDYDRMISLWEKEGPKGYVLENHKKHIDFGQNMTQIKKDHTAFLLGPDQMNVSYHTGIYIDVFPEDKVAPGAIKQKIQFACACINMLYSRDYHSEARGIVHLVEAILLSFPKKLKRYLEIKTDKYLQKWNASDMKLRYFSPVSLGDARIILPNQVFDEFCMMEFNGREYCATTEHDLVLKLTYGDYMSFPPEEERVWKHHPILIDTEHNYKELASNINH